MFKEAAMITALVFLCFHCYLKRKHCSPLEVYFSNNKKKYCCEEYLKYSKKETHVVVSVVMPVCM